MVIGYLIFISVIRNLETTNRLIGYSVKVHSTRNNGYDRLCGLDGRMIVVVKQKGRLSSSS